MTKLALVLAILLLLPFGGWAAGQQVVEIGVSGLACPFCAYSLEKNLTRLPEVDSVEIDLAANLARVVIKVDHVANLEQIKRAVVNAGFTPGDATTTIEQD